MKFPDLTLVEEYYFYSADCRALSTGSTGRMPRHREVHGRAQEELRGLRERKLHSVAGQKVCASQQGSFNSFSLK
jgi:hypothetical protein